MSIEESAPIWLRPEPGSRSPRFSREQIARAAMKLADAEGLEAVSMRRVAAELGAGTMTLYHYVSNKGDLLALMDDAMMGGLLVEGELPDDWREALRALGWAALRTWRAHPWLQWDQARQPIIGPNGIRHFEQTLAAVASTGLPTERRMEIASQVDDYVAGYAQRERDFFGNPSEEDFEDVLRPVWQYLKEELASGEYPHLEEFLGEDDFATVVRRFARASDPDERFERGLERLLDGIEQEIERSGAESDHG